MQTTDLQKFSKCMHMPISPENDYEMQRNLEIVIEKNDFTKDILSIAGYAANPHKTISRLLM